MNKNLTEKIKLRIANILIWVETDREVNGPGPCGGFDDRIQAVKALVEDYDNLINEQRSRKP